MNCSWVALQSLKNSICYQCVNMELLSMKLLLPFLHQFTIPRAAFTASLSAPWNWHKPFTATGFLLCLLIPTNALSTFKDVPKMRKYWKKDLRIWDFFWWSTNSVTTCSMSCKWRCNRSCGMTCVSLLHFLSYHVYPTCRNTSGILGFSVTVATQATKYK